MCVCVCVCVRACDSMFVSLFVYVALFMKMCAYYSIIHEHKESSGRPLFISVLTFKISEHDCSFVSFYETRKHEENIRKTDKHSSLLIYYWLKWTINFCEK